MSDAPRWGIAIGSALVFLVASNGSAAAQSTTTTPGQAKVGTNYYLVPQGTFTLPANAASWTITYDWGVVNPNGLDGPGQTPPLPTIAAPKPPNWQAANIAATVGTKYWVKSQISGTLKNGTAFGPTAFVEGFITIMR